MDNQIFTIQSKVDGLELKIAMVLPKTEIKGIIQFSHGMAEHKERYFYFMSFLAEKGFASVIHDHRGHGSSVKDSADLGYFYDETGDAIVEDLHQITLEIKNRFPNTPIILFGHSMGSLVARCYLKKYDSDIDKIIICGAPANNPLIVPAQLIVAFLKMLYGERHRSKFIQNLTFGSYNKQVGEKDLENAWLCTNHQVVEEYNNDKLCGFTFTLNGFKTLFTLVQNTYSKSGWILSNEDLPILFIAGEADPVISGEKGWLAAQRFLQDRGYKSVKGILYDNMRHEILNERNNHLVFSDVVNWLTNKLEVQTEL